MANKQDKKIKMGDGGLLEFIEPDPKQTEILADIVKTNGLIAQSLCSCQRMAFLHEEQNRKDGLKDGMGQ